MTVLLTTYAEFLARVEELGFMALSQILPGLPSLGGETAESLWHTGLDTDPWQWKDRAAEEKHLAYGCILGGHKGFVTQRMYPIFYAAFHPTLSMPERWASGTLNQTTWQLWQRFEESSALTTSQVRQALGANRKQGARAVDAALQQLQREYTITVDGNERKISAKGEFYGWPVNRYRRVEDWAPAGWLDGIQDWSTAGAREVILDDAIAMSEGVKRQALAKKLAGGESPPELLLSDRLYKIAGSVMKNQSLIWRIQPDECRCLSPFLRISLHGKPQALESICDLAVLRTIHATCELLTRIGAGATNPSDECGRNLVLRITRGRTFRTTTSCDQR